MSSSLYDYEGFVSFNEITKIINTLNIKKAQGIDQINNRSVKFLKPRSIKLLHFFLFSSISTTKHGFHENQPTKGIFLNTVTVFGQYLFDGILYKLTILGVDRNLSR